MLIEVRQLVWQPLRFASSEVESDAALYDYMDPMVFVDSACSVWKLCSDARLTAMQGGETEPRGILRQKKER